MSFEIYAATAENVLLATEAALLKPGCDKTFVAAFLDVPESSAEGNLLMAVQLGLISSTGGTYRAASPFAPYVATPSSNQRVAILRLLLEWYPPFATFVDRLRVTTRPHEAATQVGAVHGITAHRDIIKDTLINLGTFARALNSLGGSIYEPNENRVEMFEELAQGVVDRAVAERWLRGELAQFPPWAVQGDVLDPLVTGLHTFRDSPNSAVTYVGNGVEAFLNLFGDDVGCNVRGATGVNGKANNLHSAGHIKTKHKAMLNYVGHVRNGADHAHDSETGAIWTITPATSRNVVVVAISAMQGIIGLTSGRYIL
jgi:hypothetical protein